MNTKTMAVIELSDEIQKIRPILKKIDCMNYAEEIQNSEPEHMGNHALSIFMELKDKPQWKHNLSMVGDNPDYIEEQIKSIETELIKDNPDTDYMRGKIKSMSVWMDEIDLAKERAGDRAERKANPEAEECDHRTDGKLDYTIEDDGLTCREDRAVCSLCGADISLLVESEADDKED